MKSIEERIKEAVSTAAGESSVSQAYQRVLHVLEKQLDEYEYVWSPRFDPTQFAAWQAARGQLTDDIALVTALLCHATGMPLPTRAVPPRRSAGKGYGER
jgi:hypothetical protein